MKLSEILDQAANLHVAKRYLAKLGIASEVNVNCLKVRTDGDGDGTADVWVNDNSWLIRWYQGNVQVGIDKNLTFEECMERLQGPSPAFEAVTPGYKVHDGEHWERPISAPLIWRAIKHATEVEHKHVWSDIEGAEGRWTIRYSPEQHKDMELRDMRYWYVQVHADEADSTVSESWFEIIPEDDDHLAIKPDGDDGYQVYSPDGEFKP